MHKFTFPGESGRDGPRLHDPRPDRAFDRFWPELRPGTDPTPFTLLDRLMFLAFYLEALWDSHGRSCNPGGHHRLTASEVKGLESRAPWAFPSLLTLGLVEQGGGNWWLTPIEAKERTDRWE